MDTTTERGKGEVVELAMNYTGEGAEYIESNDSVRYISGYEDSPDDNEKGQPVYETAPFDRWAAINALERASERVVGIVVEELDIEDTDSISPGFTLGPDYRIKISVTTSLNRSGTAISTPQVSVEAVSAVAPRKVSVEYSFEGQEFTAEFPVVVERLEQQQQ